MGADPHLHPTPTRTPTHPHPHPRNKAHICKGRIWARSPRRHRPPPLTRTRSWGAADSPPFHAEGQVTLATQTPGHGALTRAGRSFPWRTREPCSTAPGRVRRFLGGPGDPGGSHPSRPREVPLRQRPKFPLTPQNPREEAEEEAGLRASAARGSQARASGRWGCSDKEHNVGCGARARARRLLTREAGPPRRCWRPHGHLPGACGTCSWEPHGGFPGAPRVITWGPHKLDPDSGSSQEAKRILTQGVSPGTSTHRSPCCAHFPRVPWQFWAPGSACSSHGRGWPFSHLDHPTECRVWGKTTEEKTPAVKDPRDHRWPPGCWGSGCLWGPQPWLSERTRGRHSPGVMLGLWGAVGSVSSFHTHSAFPTRGGAVTSPPSSNP